MRSLSSESRVETTASLRLLSLEIKEEKRCRFQIGEITGGKLGVEYKIHGGDEG